MFLSTHALAQSTGAAVDHCSALYTASMHALFDAGQDAAEHYADFLRSFFASATVTARQAFPGALAWHGAGAFDRQVSLMQHAPQVGTPQSQPVGMVPAHVSDSKTGDGQQQGNLLT